MPLLPLEPYLYPENLLAADSSEVGTWWVLHVRSRAEKSLARKLLGEQQRFFLPLGRNEWRNAGRRFCSHVPLFPGYLFLYGDEKTRLAALATNLVVRVLPVQDQARLRDDLVRVHALMSSGVPLRPEPELPLGSEVEITRGPLVGMNGQVVRRGGRYRFVVEVRFIRSAVSVEIPGSWLAPCGVPLVATS